MPATPVAHLVAVMLLVQTGIALAGTPVAGTPVAGTPVAGASVAGASAAGDPATGDPKRGAELAPLCTGCHGPDGRSNLSRYPSIAGLDPEVFTARMQALQAGESGHLLMRMTRGLSDQDIADLAAHFATLE